MEMPKRTLKQVLYGGAFLLFWAAIFSGIYFLVLKPAPSCFDNRKNQDETEIDCGGSCIACALKNVKGLEVQSAISLPVGERTTLLGRVLNSNELVGASLFDYEFRVYGAGEELLAAISGKTFVYPNKLRYIIEPAADIDPKKVLRVDLEVKNPVWNLDVEFASPNTQLREVKTEAIGQSVKTSGTFVNNSNLPVSRALIQAVFYNNLGTIVAASQTELRDISPFQNRRFEIPHPAVSNLDPGLTRVFAESIF